MTAANTCSTAPVSKLGIRWDAVVAPGSGTAAPARPQRDVERSTDSVQVHVQLYGALATACAQRSVRLELPAATSIAEVLIGVEQHLDAPILTHVMNEAGLKHRHCRLFVGGYAVEDLQTPLPATTSLTEIDIILLIAPEGG